MRKVLVVAIVAMVTALTSAHAQHSMSGNYWLEKCSGAELLACVSFLQGMDAMHGLKGGEPLYCLPEGVNFAVVTAIVTSYLQKNPGTRDLPFAMLAVMALADVFPCHHRPR